MNDKLAIAIVLTVALAFAFPGCGAWGNGGYSEDQSNPDYGTHDWISDRAIELVTTDKTFLSTTFHSSFLLGTESPDNPKMIGDTWNHHVYYDRSGLVTEDNSARRARETASAARSLMTAGDFELAAYYIGAMSHYIADVGVFGHTMGSDTAWGEEEHHADYEAEMGSRILSLAPPPRTSITAKDPYEAALDLAAQITFGHGDIKPNGWMDNNYDWSYDVFVTSAYASIYASIYAVASAIQYLLQEPPSPGTVPDESTDVDLPSENVPSDETADSSEKEGIGHELIVYLLGASTAVVIAVIAALTRKRAK
ncbi:MAG: zinc dependent phospholipase C family protein [Thermoplasmata archaeon]